MTEKCPKSMRKKIYRNMLQRESIDPCGRRETFKAQSHLSRLRARNKDPVVEKSIPVVVSFVLLLVHPFEIHTWKNRCAFQQLTVLLSIMIAMYLPTVYHISSRKTHFWFSKWHCTLLKTQLIQSLPFFCRSDQFEGEAIFVRRSATTDGNP